MQCHRTFYKRVLELQSYDVEVLMLSLLLLFFIIVIITVVIVSIFLRRHIVISKTLCYTDEHQKFHRSFRTCSFIGPFKLKF